MNRSHLPDDDRDAPETIQPLEPGRPDIMPNPPPAGDDDTPNKDDSSAPVDDGVELDENMSDVEAVDLVTQEHPPQR